MFSSRAVGVLVLPLFAAVAGCAGSSSEAREEKLRDAASELVPASSAILGDEAGACVEFADEPSCLTLFFAVRGMPPLEERVRRARQAAANGGWTLEDSTFARGGTELRFFKDEMSGRIVLWLDAASRCDLDVPSGDCGDLVDHIQVVRG